MLINGLIVLVITIFAFAASKFCRKRAHKMFIYRAYLVILVNIGILSVLNTSHREMEFEEYKVNKQKMDSNFKGVFLALMVTYFFVNIYHAVFTVKDDLETYINVRRGILGNTAINGAFTGRITHLYNTILLGIPMFADKLPVYKMFSYGSILFDVFVFYKLII